MTIYEAICPVCKTGFKSIRENKKFCSEKCSRRYWKIKRGAVKLLKTCPTCGENFETYLKRMIYCKKECYKKALSETYEKRSLLGLRYAILIRDKFKCQYCGRTPQGNGVILHIDHIVPKSKGGENIKENLVAACEDCNMGKSNVHFGEILTYLKDKNFNIYKKWPRI